MPRDFRQRGLGRRDYRLAGLRDAPRLGEPEEIIYADGVIDEIHISRALRSEAWVNAAYNNMASPGTFVVPGTPRSLGAGSLSGLSVDWNESVRAINRVMPVEALAGVGVTHATVVEWAGGVSIVRLGSAPIDWGTVQQVQKRVNTDYGVKLAASARGPVDYGLSVNRSATAMLEALAGISVASYQAIDWGGTTARGARIPEDYGTTTTAGQKAPVDYGTGVDRTTQVPLDAMTGTARFARTPVEWRGGIGVTFKGSAPIEWCGGISRPYRVNADWKSTMGAAVASINIDWLAGLTCGVVAVPIDYGGTIVFAPYMPVEWEGIDIPAILVANVAILVPRVRLAGLIMAGVEDAKALAAGVAGQKLLGAAAADVSVKVAAVVREILKGGREV